MKRHLAITIGLLLSVAPAHAEQAIANNGTPFTMENRQGHPQPVVITLAGATADALSDPYSRIAITLRADDALRVAFDLPAHGADVRSGESSGLVGWLQRINRGEDVVSDGVARIADIVRTLQARGYSDADRVVLVGFSRGAFLAVHAVNRGVRATVVGLMPVTDLAALSEFAGLDQWPYIRNSALDVVRSPYPVWLLAGSYDPRVDSTRTIAMYERTVAWWAGTHTELHCLQTEGHSVPDAAYPLAVAWIRSWWAKPNGGL